MRRTIEFQTERESIHFDKFESILKVLLNLDSLDLEQEKEYMNDWYGLFKDTKFDTVLEWAAFQFADVTKETHDFWIDARGYKLFQIEVALRNQNPGMIFPTF